MTGAVELQLLARQVELNGHKLAAIEQQIGNMQFTLEQHDVLLTTLNALQEKNNDSSVMIPLGAGVSIQTAGPLEGGALIDVGAGILLNRPFPDVIEMISERREEIVLAISILEEDKTSLEKLIQELSAKLDADYQNLQAGGLSEAGIDSLPAGSELTPAIEKPTPAVKEKRSGGTPSSIKKGDLSLDD